MPSIPVDVRASAWTDSRGRRGHFVPNPGAPIELQPPRSAWPNPAERLGGKTLSARLFIGLSVNKKPRWKVNDVVRIVKRVRLEQTGAVGASFLTQRGLYTQSTPKGDIIVDEQSVQVIIIDEQGLTKTEWKAQIVRLAEVLAAALKQDPIVVELQRAGIVQDTYSVRA